MDISNIDELRIRHTSNIAANAGFILLPKCGIERKDLDELC